MTRSAHDSAYPLLFRLGKALCEGRAMDLNWFGRAVCNFQWNSEPGCGRCFRHPAFRE